MPYIPPPQYRPDPLEMEFMNQRLAILESDMPDERKKAALREARARYERQMAMRKKLTWRYSSVIFLGMMVFIAAGSFFMIKKQILVGISMYILMSIFIIVLSTNLDRRIRNA
jgi:hypothetical protein